MTEVKNGKKMKIVGYLCIAFSAILSISMLLPFVDVEQGIGLPLVYFWTGTGITLLFGNAAKRIVGGTQMDKHPRTGI